MSSESAFGTTMYPPHVNDPEKYFPEPSFRKFRARHEPKTTMVTDLFKSWTIPISSLSSLCQSILPYQVSGRSEHSRTSYEPKTTPMTDLFKRWTIPKSSLSSLCPSILPYRFSCHSEHFPASYEPKTTPVTDLFKSWTF